MKRIIAMVMVAMIVMANVAMAEIDLSGMTYDELVALKDQINKAMWECEEWQEVTVPQGIWKIGEDIPEGHWTVKAADGARVSILWGDSMIDSAMVSPDHWCWTLTSPSNGMFEENESRIEIDGELKAGQYIQIDNGKAVFTPYSGKPDLGFK